MGSSKDEPVVKQRHKCHVFLKGKVNSLSDICQKLGKNPIPNSALCLLHDVHALLTEKLPQLPSPFQSLESPGRSGWKQSEQQVGTGSWRLES